MRHFPQVSAPRMLLGREKGVLLAGMHSPSGSEPMAKHKEHVRVRYSRYGMLALVALIAFGGLAAACGDDSRAGDTEAPARVNLGVVLTLTGPNSVFGLSSKAGIELALEEINANGAVPGVRIDATFIDDTGDAAKGAELFGELAASDTDVIFGPTLSNTAFVADPVAQAAGLPVVAVSNTAQGITGMGDYIFRVSLGEEVVIPRTLATVAEQRAPKTAVLLFADDDAWSRSSADLMRQAAVANGIQIVDEGTFATAATDFAAQLAIVQTASPDIMLVAALEQPSARIVQQARQLGIATTIVCGNGCNSKHFLEDAGTAAEGVIVGASWNSAREHAASTSFVAAYRAKFGSDPDQFAAQGYAAVYILAEAMQQPDAIDRAELRAALAAVADVDTVLGTFAFDAERNPAYEPVVQIVEGGKLRVFE